MGHTADVILEASGPDLASCFEEAVAALVELYADPRGAVVVDERAVTFEPAADDLVLLDLLEEVIFLLDTGEAVPVGATVHVRSEGGVDAVLALASAGSVIATGAVPKAVSRSELSVSREPDGVRCSFLVDV